MNKDRILLLIGITGLSIPFFILLTATAGFVAGLSLSIFHLPFAFCCSLGLGYAAARIVFPGNWKKPFLLTALFWPIFSILLFWGCGYLFDYTYDGQSYHQDIMAAIADGWNPVYRSHSPDETPTSLWVNHYNKGLETIQAVVNTCFGNIEAGKGISFIGVLSSLCLCGYMLTVRLRMLSGWKRFFYAVSFTCCPVVLCQWLTYYIDWSMYSLLLSLVSVFCLLQDDKEDILFYMAIGMIIFMAACFKFNILFFTGLAVLFYCLLLMLEKRYGRLKRIILTGGLSLVAGIVVGAYNPFITNTLEHRNPFYPLMGEEKVDIMTDNTPSKLKGKNRLESMVRAYFSYPTNSRAFPVEWAVPATVRRPQEIYNIMVDQRVGGFGAFFSAILLISTFVFLFTLREKTKYRGYFLYLLSALIVSLFILPSGWWARYVPFFWAVPLVMLCYTEIAGLQYSWLRFLRSAAYLLVLVTIFILGGISFKTAVDYTGHVEEWCTKLQTFNPPVRVSFGVFPAYRKKFERYGVLYQVVSKDTDTSIKEKIFLFGGNSVERGIYVEIEKDTTEIILQNK